MVDLVRLVKPPIGPPDGDPPPRDPLLDRLEHGAHAVGLGREAVAKLGGHRHRDAVGRWSSRGQVGQARARSSGRPIARKACAGPAPEACAALRFAPPMSSASQLAVRTPTCSPIPFISRPRRPRGQHPKRQRRSVVSHGRSPRDRSARRTSPSTPSQQANQARASQPAGKSRLSPTNDVVGLGLISSTTVSSRGSQRKSTPTNPRSPEIDSTADRSSGSATGRGPASRPDIAELTLLELHHLPPDADEVRG